jgi:tRNA A-37 threonylcarbamoyl transferase component Bud32
LKLYGLRARLPRVREYYNLCWLVERLFQTPLPLAAGALVTRGLPAYQFLLTQEVPDAETLEAFLQHRDRADRITVLDEIARETARMHALGFIHHDLYPRNLLVAHHENERRENARRVFFLDAWAGGPAPQARGPAYDLGCFLLRADETLEHQEVERFLDLYAAERAAQDRPVNRTQLELGAKRARARLARKALRRRSPS